MKTEQLEMQLLAIKKKFFELEIELKEMDNLINSLENDM